MLNQEFITQYKAELEAKLTRLLFQHASTGSAEFTLAHASHHLEVVMSTVFGNEEHGGIVDFLTTQPHLPQDPQALVKLAENYMDKGWHIAQNGDRFWLLSAEFKKVADVTGPSSTMSTEEDIVITTEQTSLFLSEEDSQMLISAAEKMNIDKSLLKSPSFAKQMVEVNYPTDKKMLSIAISYSNLGRILDMSEPYPYAEDNKVTAEELYQMGYKLEDKLYPSKDVKVYLTNNQNPISVRPVLSDESALISAANSLKAPLSRYGVELIAPIALTSLDTLYGVIFKGEDLEHFTLDYAEMESLLTSVPSNGYMPDKVKAKVSQAIAVYLATQLFVCGDASFNIGHMSIDLTSFKLYGDYTGSMFTRSFDDLNFAVMNMNTYGDPMNTSDMFTVAASYVDTSKQGLASILPSLVAALPKDYLQVMDSAQFVNKNVSEYVTKSMDLLKTVLGGNQ